MLVYASRKLANSLADSQMEQTLPQRINDYIWYPGLTSEFFKKEKVISNNFNLLGYSIADVSVVILEKKETLIISLWGRLLNSTCNLKRSEQAQVF